MESLGDWLEVREHGEHLVPVVPWTSRLVVLLHIADDGGAATSAHNVVDKRELAQRDDGRLFVIWPGQHKTTTREATADERARLRELLR